MTGSRNLISSKAGSVQLEALDVITFGEVNVVRVKSVLWEVVGFMKKVKSVIQNLPQEKLSSEKEVRR